MVGEDPLCDGDLLCEYKNQCSVLFFLYRILWAKGPGWEKYYGEVLECVDGQRVGLWSRQEE